MVPEFMYEAMYDENHRFRVLHRDPDVKDRILQKGLRERLLCADCEQQFGRYERYASLLLNDSLETSWRRTGSLITVEGVDYRLFKLFQMSVLWRAGICSLPFFSKVRLGVHEEKLRELLSREDVGRSRDYGCMLGVITRGNKVERGVMAQPTTTRADGALAYRFVFGGLVWVYVVASHATFRVLESFSLHPDRELRMLVSEVTEIDFLDRTMRGITASRAARSAV